MMARRGDVVVRGPPRKRDVWAGIVKEPAAPSLYAISPRRTRSTADSSQSSGMFTPAM
jgi:hypothetical protein